MSLAIEERVKYYLGELYDIHKIQIADNRAISATKLIPENINSIDDLSSYFKEYNYNKLYDITNLYNINYTSSLTIQEIIKKKLIPDMFFKCYFNDYAKPLRTRLVELNIGEAQFLCDFCDIFYKINRYAFVKNRYSGLEKKTVILRCLNKKRHWNLYYNRPDDIPFDNKLNSLYWRGTTTGSMRNPANRFHLVKKYYNRNPNIDIGFSFTCQGNEKYNAYVKGKDDISTFLKHKYILSLEGNDKDSGLNWKLNSNSLVLMPKPRSSSWLMEDKLMPDVHYVLIKDDFSDIEEKIEWCNQHQDNCVSIVKNANRFMEQFKDEHLEEEIEERVIKLYFEKVSFRNNGLK